MKRLTIRGTALALGVFFDVSFALCVLWGLALPRVHAKGSQLLEALIPGFTWLTPQSFLLGLLWSTLLAVYVAVVFVPLFNYFEGKAPSEARKPALAGQGQPRETILHR
ncbi:MAG: hypothetical protein HYY54_07060 [candidate division NC10 bacterium]|nr:hypothetical protein [candidate division NC10 bacterium]MBI4390607.1 hypothetical protein [candidate division NC10 bacterium]